MDHDAHDPSRNMPHFWRHEHTTFSDFIKAREKPHRKKDRLKNMQRKIYVHELIIYLKKNYIFI